MVGNNYFDIKYSLLLIFGLLQMICSNSSLAEKINTDIQTGLASYYAESHHLTKTASGELYMNNAMTASHMTFPLGSLVKVLNVANGKSVVVRVNDRGHFSRGRVIDLSKAAFNTIGNTRLGLIKVRLEIIR